MENSPMADPEKGDVKFVFDLLKSGEENIHLAGNRNVVLILGNTGSGKSTFTQFIAGDNDNLESVEVSEGLAEFVIIDKDKKISGDSTTVSKTLFPDLYISEKTGTLFYDCPGFSDTRSAAHDISTTYFIKKVIDSAKSVKLVFLVNYPSVRKGVDRKDFILLVHHITALLKDIDKYKNSIALVVTKVDNQFVMKNGKATIVPDGKVISSIADFLKMVKTDVHATAKFPTASSGDSKEFTKKASQLIDALLEKKGDSYTKIGLFRRPNEPGQISKSVFLQDGKAILENMIANHIHFIEKHENDFGFTISPESKNCVQDLADEINDNLTSEISGIGSKIKKYTIKEEDNVKDISVLLNKFAIGVDILSKYESDSIEQSKKFIKKLLEDIHYLNTSISTKGLLNVINLNDYLSFLELVSGKNLKNPLRWSLGLRYLNRYFKSSKKWYSFLNSLESWLSEYDIQKQRLEIKITTLQQQCDVLPDTEITVEKLHLKQLLDQIKEHKKLLDIEAIYNDIKDMTVDYAKLGILKQVLDVTINHNTEFVCAESNKLVVKGKFVKLSEISHKKCQQKIQYIELFALNKVFIDNDFNNKGNKLQISIISPIWDIIGNRKIILDGKSGEKLIKAKDGIGYSSSGQEGRPGTPGESASNILGIADKVIGGHLYISSVGGQGGSGQDGGNGVDGKPGKDPTPPRSSTARTVFNQWGPEYDWEDDGFTWEFTGTWERILVAWYHYRAKGTPATRGGNGGHGGVGGYGGKGGTINIIDNSNSGKIDTSNHSGNRGPVGKGGLGGNGAKNGMIGRVECRIDRYLLVAVTYCSSGRNEYNGMSRSGDSGQNGLNSFGIVYPEKALEMVDPMFTINGFKTFVRENLPQNIKASSINEFVAKLEAEKGISDLYSTLGLVNELEGLENQFSKLNGNLDITPFYKSLLKRIEKYAMSPKAEEKSLEHKKILAYLYTATLSKISSLMSKNKDDLVVEIPLFLDVVSKNINELNSIQSNIAINEVMMNYKKGIERQIRTARENVKLNIIPELSSIFDKIDEKIVMLFTEVIISRQEIDQKKHDVREKQEKLENKMILKYLLGPVKMIAEFLDLSGPIGEEVTKKAIDGLSIVSHMLTLNGDSITVPDLSQFLKILSNIAGDSLMKMNDISRDHYGLFDAQLKDMISNMKKHLDTNEKSTLGSIQNNFIETKSALENEVSKEKVLDPSLIDQKRKTLMAIIDNKKTSLGKEMNGTSEELDILNFNKQILDMNNIPKDLYLSIGQDQAKLETLEETLKSLNEKIKAIEIFENKIYKIIIPRCNHLKKVLEIDESSLAGKTLDELDIRKWGIQTTVNDIKVEIRQLTKSLNVGEDLTRCIEKIDETLSIVFNTYSRIDDLHEKAKLAAYIADINTPKAQGIMISDSGLQSALRTLNLSIKSNLILEQYNRAIEAFTQYVFPLANIYLKELNLPPTFNLKTNLDSLTFIATQKLGIMKTKLLESSASINKYDKYIHTNIHFNGDTKHTKAFFVWKNELNKNTIDKLLDGREVNLKADINSGINENAVKFNEIGIRFRVQNETLQRELNENLENFEVSMTHHGQSSYKCGNTFYTINSDKQTLSYHFKNDRNGHPVNTNLVYSKIKSNDPMLSPYTMWTIKLQHPLNYFRALNKYKKENLDLELVGRGQYIERDEIDIEICNKDLENYYQVDESLSEFNTIYQYLEEERGNVSTEINLLQPMATYRRKRSNKDYEEFASSGASVSKSSPINSIMNSILFGVSLLRSLSPFSQVKQLTGDKDNVLLEENNDFAPSYTMGISEQPWKQDSLYFEAISDESTNFNEVIDDTQLHSSSNLLLWNLLVRKLGSEKKYSRKMDVKNNQQKGLEMKHASSHSLAYRHYDDENLQNFSESSEDMNACSDFKLTALDDFAHITHREEIYNTNQKMGTEIPRLL